jgi:large subunit ribosomal protein L35
MWEMPKLKTHKGVKKRFKVSATGKVSHKRCGSSHLMSHKSGKQVRRLRKKPILTVSAEAKRLRRAVHENEGAQPDAIAAARLAALAESKAAPTGEPGTVPETQQPQG